MVFAALKAAGLKCGLAIRPAVAASRGRVTGEGLPFLRNRVWQYGLI
jgi:hypothetical protein